MNVRTVAFAVVTTAALPISLFGQVGITDTGDARVQGTGTVVIERVPESLRMQVAILGKGAGLKEAVAALKKQVDSAKAQVVKLGADEASIKVEPARIFQQQNDRQRQMEMMMAQRMRGGGKKNAKNKPVQPITVASTLTATWKLKAKDAEDLLLTVHPLQEKIKSADLAGSKDAEKLSPEEEEALAEAEAAPFEMYGSGEEAKPGEPEFVFVGRISEEDRAAALSEAFKKAQAEAQRLAKAADAGLGRLKSIQDTNYGGGDVEDYTTMSYNPRAYRLLQAARGSQGKQDGPLEAIGVEPGLVRYSVNVIASFEVVPAK